MRDAIALLIISQLTIALSFLAESMVDRFGLLLIGAIWMIGYIIAVNNEENI